ncbi:hypothetical protein Acr_28g0015040 [Actinidia rufa]|uniref:Uncharacterized protein n=1 Tax=Actinidia rufa TaxID=165716 RepID=A0A7J0HCL2_9ERIC|nr:hypothetical protein Acr_28g0015040 [Actinidia rufa]
MELHFQKQQKEIFSATKQSTMRKKMLDGFEVPKRIGLAPQTNSFEMDGDRIPEFEHMKVERQISASLYAMNGVNEYWENVHDSGDAFWDLPTLCQMFCPN